MISKRLLQGARSVPVKDRALGFTLGVPGIEEALDLSEELLDAQPPDVQPSLRSTRRIGARLLCGSEPLGTRAPDHGVPGLTPERKEVRDRTPHLERPGADEGDPPSTSTTSPS